MKYDPTHKLFTYRKPNPSLLTEFDSVPGNVNTTMQSRIVEVLADFDVKVEASGISIGSAITQYEFKLASGTKVSKIAGLEEDLALHLGVASVRILAPIKGKSAVGIEIPNENPSIVGLKKILNSEAFKNTNMELPIAMGETTTGEPFIFDLTKMPHLLIGGATGQGKSVGINALISSLLFSQHPTKMKLVLIDVKKVELSLYEKLSNHFLVDVEGVDQPIITDTENALKAFNGLISEMDCRYELLRHAGCRNIVEYNNKICNRELDDEDGHRYLPYIVVVIDEFADLMMVSNGEIERPITRLAQLARAIGIHLVIATQRPSTNVVTGLIKANFPSRIAFRTISNIDSRTILDSKGAEQLIGRGDMLFSNGADHVRVQTAFVDTKEINDLCEYIGSQDGFDEKYQVRI